MHLTLEVRSGQQVIMLQIVAILFRKYGQLIMVQIVAIFERTYFYYIQ